MAPGKRAENGCAVEANLLVYNYAFSAGGGYLA